MVRIPLIVLAAGLTLGSAAAYSQDSEGTVTVNLTGVEAQLITDLSLTAEQIPDTLELPVGIAAQACGIKASEIAKAKQGDATYSCNATSTSKALEQAVKKQVP